MREREREEAIPVYVFMRGGYRTEKKERTDTPLVFEPSSRVRSPTTNRHLPISDYFLSCFFFFFLTAGLGYKKRVIKRCDVHFPQCAALFPSSETRQQSAALDEPQRRESRSLG